MIKWVGLVVDNQALVRQRVGSVDYTTIRQLPLLLTEYQRSTLDSGIWTEDNISLKGSVSRITYRYSVISGLLELEGIRRSAMVYEWTTGAISWLVFPIIIIIIYIIILWIMEMNNTDLHLDRSLKNTIGAPEGFVASHGSFNRVKKASPAVSLLLSMPVIR